MANYPRFLSTLVHPGFVGGISRVHPLKQLGWTNHFFGFVGTSPPILTLYCENIIYNFITIHWWLNHSVKITLVKPTVNPSHWPPGGSPPKSCKDPLGPWVIPASLNISRSKVKESWFVVFPIDSWVTTCYTYDFMISMCMSLSPLGRSKLEYAPQSHYFHGAGKGDPNSGKMSTSY